MNQVSNFSVIFIILALIITGQIKVEGRTCSRTLGECTSSFYCDKRCTAQHSGGVGVCYSNVCYCDYPCGPIIPHPRKTCKDTLGTCDFKCDNVCCNSRCEGKYGSEGIGECQTVGSSNLCTCEYVCG
uniref:Defensin-like protein n=1 Tax=Cajanus cajan TaxID=3821 RepID=A0A151T5I3_CAJCA|nr:Defensin-like protein 183 family [Cajanus cajan]